MIPVLTSSFSLIPGSLLVIISVEFMHLNFLMGGGLCLALGGFLFSFNCSNVNLVSHLRCWIRKQRT